MNLQLKLMLLAGATALSAAAQSDKFDSMSNFVLDSYQQSIASKDFDVKMLKDFKIEISETGSRGVSATGTVIIELADGATPEDIETVGFEVVSTLGNIVVARGSMDDMNILADQDFVKSLSFSQLSRPMLNETRSLTGDQDVQDGTGLPSKFNGAGVIAGIWDTGIQPNHVNFLTANGSRFEQYWMFTGNGSATAYNSDNIAGFTTDDPSETHGTHTLGCMAGSWNGAGMGGVSIMAGKWSATAKNPYYGMAPGASIVGASGELYNDNTISAVSKIVNYANEVKKPVVINLSIGSNYGPHDGSDQVGVALKNAAQKGAIIFVSAGNEGAENISIVEDFTSSKTSVQTFVKTTGGVSDYAQIWSNSSEGFTVTLQVYNLNTKTVEYSYDYTPTGSATFRLGSKGVANDAFSKAFNGSTSYVALSRSNNTGTNNRYSATVTMVLELNTTTNARGANYALGIKITGKAGQRVDMTTAKRTYFTDNGISGYTNGSPDFSINDMACNPYVIAVGSWNGRVNAPCKAGSLGWPGYKNGDVSGFSSYGTTFDGRKLPTICAPGVNVISSISTYYYNSQMANTSTANYISAQQSTPNGYSINPGQQNYWEAESGTSMASPVAAGIVCTWLQANPYLTYSDVIKILTETADNTNLPTASPMARWGGGKINALAGIKKVLNMGVNDVLNDGNNVLLTAMGDNVWNAFVAGAKNITAEIYNLSGAKVASASAEGDSVDISGQGLAKGIYVVTINGANAERIVIK